MLAEQEEQKSEGKQRREDSDGKLSFQIPSSSKRLSKQEGQELEERQRRRDSTEPERVQKTPPRKKHVWLDDEVFSEDS